MMKKVKIGGHRWTNKWGQVKPQPQYRQPQQTKSSSTSCDETWKKNLLQNFVSSFRRIKIFPKCCCNNWKIFETLAKNSHSFWDLSNKSVQPTEFQAFKGKLNVPTCFQGRIYCVSWTRGATRWNSFGYCLSIRPLLLCSHSPPPSTCIFSTSWSFNQSFTPFPRFAMQMWLLLLFWSILLSSDSYVKICPTLQYMPYAEMERSRI